MKCIGVILYLLSVNATSIKLSTILKLTTEFDFPSFSFINDNFKSFAGIFIFYFCDMKANFK